VLYYNGRGNILQDTALNACHMVLKQIQVRW